MGICCGQFADHVAVPVGVDETITAHRLGMERPERKTIRSFTIKSMDYFVLFSGDVGISVSGRAISTETAERERPAVMQKASRDRFPLQDVAPRDGVRQMTGRSRRARLEPCRSIIGALWAMAQNAPRASSGAWFLLKS